MHAPKTPLAEVRQFWQKKSRMLERMRTLPLEQSASPPSGLVYRIVVD